MRAQIVHNESNALGASKIFFIDLQKYLRVGATISGGFTLFLFQSDRRPPQCH